MRVANGPEYGAYFHKFFIRDKPHLAAQMFCKNARTMFAMASDGVEKKTEAVVMKTDLASASFASSSVNQLAVGLLPVRSFSSLGRMPKIGVSTPSLPMGLPYALLLQREKEKVNNLLVDRAIAIQQQQTHQDRLLQVRRMMEASFQQNRLQQLEESHHPMMNQERNGDRLLPNINRASAA